MSEELEKVKPTEVKIKIKGIDREIKYGFSAWAKLEDMYGGLKNFSKIEKDIQERPFHVLPELLWIGVVNKDGLEQENFLDEYGLDDIPEIVDALKKSLYGSLPKDKKKVGSQAVK